MGSALNIMAWREILAKTMQGFTVEEDVSPDWLVNPATRRRLKLDLLYPQVGLAIRFVGVTAKGQPKQSDWELLEETQRDQTREELCRQHGIELFLLDADYAYPNEQLQRLRLLLTRLAANLEQSKLAKRDRAGLSASLTDARSQLDNIVRRVKSPDDLATFAELWRDREMTSIVTPRPVAPSTSTRPLKLAAGARVQHTRFGPGTVSVITADSSDPQLTILFDNGEQRTFLASLVSDKLQAI